METITFTFGGKLFRVPKHPVQASIENETWLSIRLPNGTIVEVDYHNDDPFEILGVQPVEIVDAVLVDEEAEEA